jgi:hypothetical protein
MVQGGETAVDRPAAPPRRQPPGSLASAALAADRSPRRSVVAPQIGCRLRCPTRNCPCATARPAAGHAPPHCWSARRPRRGQRSTGRPTSGHHRPQPGALLVLSPAGLVHVDYCRLLDCGPGLLHYGHQVGGVLAQPGFQLADAGLPDGILGAQRGLLPPEHRQLLQERRWLRSRQHRPYPGGQRHLDHAAVLAHPGRLVKLAAGLSNGGAERLPQS